MATFINRIVAQKTRKPYPFVLVLLKDEVEEVIAQFKNPNDANIAGKAIAVACSDDYTVIVKNSS